ncbi:MAG: hypothetical protein AAF471_07935, partial [Myxococcota bacterium]
QRTRSTPALARLPSLRAKRESGRGEGEKWTALQARAEQGGVGGDKGKRWRAGSPKERKRCLRHNQRLRDSGGPFPKGKKA